MPRFLCALAIIVLLGGLSSACRKKHVQIPVSTPPASSEAAPEATPPATTPPVSTAPATQPPAAPAQEEQKNKPVGPQPQPTANQPQAPAQPPRRSPRPSDQSAGQPPRLGDVLTAQQVQAYNAAIDQSLARTQASLNAIASRQLTKDQQAVVAQVQSFVQQAQTTRKSNLTAARSLAERAEVLARDLAGSLR